MRRVRPAVAVALLGLAPAASPAPAALACTSTGAWDTAFGEMRLTQSGSTVTGDYAWDEGRLSGTATGNVLNGAWTEAHSRQPPDDAGDFAFTMADDCRSFTGTWRYGSTGELGGEWA